MASANSIASRAQAWIRSRLGRADTSGAVVFAYHDVTPDAEGPHHVTPSQFEAHLQVAVDSGWSFVPVTTIVGRIERHEPVDGLAAITFDDAWRGLPEHALPQLAARDLTASIFVITRRHDPSKYMVDDQLHDAIAQGMTIGSHSRSHPSLPSLDADALRLELEGSRLDLRDRFGVDADLLAYPHGHVDDRVSGAASALGYRAGFTFHNGKVAPQDDLMRISRLTMGPHHSPRRLAYHLARGPEAWPAAAG